MAAQRFGVQVAQASQGAFQKMRVEIFSCILPDSEDEAGLANGF